MLLFQGILEETEIKTDVLAFYLFPSGVRVNNARSIGVDVASVGEDVAAQAAVQ